MASTIKFGNTVLIDLSLDSVDPDSLLERKTAHDEFGSRITGRLVPDQDIHIENEGATVIEEEELLVLSGENDIYQGESIVVPQDYDQLLETENKFMETDILIESVPYQKVTNLGGGYTVMIG